MTIDDLKVALLALPVINSANLGNPLTLVISDDVGRAEAALNAVIPMVPPDRILEVVNPLTGAVEKI